MRRIMMRAAMPVAAAAAMATVLIGPGTAAAAQATMSIGTGSLVAKGVAVSVPVEVTCDPNPFLPTASNSVMVVLKERVNKDLAVGSGSGSVTCDGTPQVVEVLVQAQNVAFKPGTALATASIFLCDFTCSSTATTAETRIRN